MCGDNDLKVKCPRGNILQEIVSIGNDLTREKLADFDDIVKALKDDLLERLVRGDNPCLKEEHLIYITIPFQSARLGDEGDWLPTTPVWCSGDGEKWQENARSYATLYTIIRGYLGNFGFTELAYKYLNKRLPRYILLKKSKDGKAVELVKIETETDGNTGYGLILQYPGDSDNWNEARDKFLEAVKQQLKDQQYHFHQSDDGYIDTQEIETFHNNMVGPIKEAFTNATRGLMEQDEVIDFIRRLSTELADDKCSEFIKLNRGGLETLSKYLVKFFFNNKCSLQDWERTYFFPSKTHWDKGYEVGCGGPIIAFKEDFELSIDCKKCIWLKTSLKLREFALVDWEEKARFEGRERGKKEIALDISHMLKNRFHARCLPLVRYFGNVGYVIYELELLGSLLNLVNVAARGYFRISANSLKHELDEYDLVKVLTEETKIIQSSLFLKILESERKEIEKLCRGYLMERKDKINSKVESFVKIVEQKVYAQWGKVGSGNLMGGLQAIPDISGVDISGKEYQNLLTEIWNCDNPEEIAALFRGLEKLMLDKTQRKLANITIQISQKGERKELWPKKVYILAIVYELIDNATDHLARNVDLENKLQFVLIPCHSENGVRFLIINDFIGSEQIKPKSGHGLWVVEQIFDFTKLGKLSYQSGKSKAQIIDYITENCQCLYYDELLSNLNDNGKYFLVDVLINQNYERKRED